MCLLCTCDFDFTGSTPAAPTLPQLQLGSSERSTCMWPQEALFRQDSIVVGFENDNYLPCCVLSSRAHSSICSFPSRRQGWLWHLPSLFFALSQGTTFQLLGGQAACLSCWVSWVGWAIAFGRKGAEGRGESEMQTSPLSSVRDLDLSVGIKRSSWAWGFWHCSFKLDPQHKLFSTLAMKNKWPLVTCLEDKWYVNTINILCYYHASCLNFQLEILPSFFHAKDCIFML